MDFGVIHPIPLTVADIVAQFHVLDALGRGQGERPEHPPGPGSAGTDHQTGGEVEAALNSDGALDIGPVVRTAIGLRSVGCTGRRGCRSGRSPGMGVGRNTVRRALAAEGPPKYQRPARGSKVDAVEPQIPELLRLHRARASIMSGHARRSCLRITASISSAPHPPRRAYRMF